MFRFVRIAMPAFTMLALIGGSFFTSIKEIGDQEFIAQRIFVQKVGNDPNKPVGGVATPHTKDECYVIDRYLSQEAAIRYTAKISLVLGIGRYFTRRK